MPTPFLHEHIVLPLSDFLTGMCVHSSLRRLLQAEAQPIEVRLQHQQQQLRQMLRYATQRVPFYRRWLAEADLSPDDLSLSSLPIVSKATLRAEGIEAFMAEGVAPRQCLAAHSNGTTDVPINYFIDRRAASVNIAAKLCTWYAAGYRLGDSYVKIAGADRHSFIKCLQDWANNSLYLRLTEVSEASLSAILDAIEARRPRYLRTYPHAAYYLARRRMRGSYSHRLRGIFTTGACLTPAMRATICEAFGCDVIDSYSCEGVANTAETPRHDGYHSCLEYGIVEVLGEDLQPVADGMGTVVATELCNRAMPLLRYRTDDLVEVRGGTIVRVVGRANERLLLPGGGTLTGSQLLPLLAGFDAEVAAYQLCCQADALTLRVIPTAAYSSSVGQAMAERVQHLVGLPVGLATAEFFAITHNGKHRTLVNL